MQSLLRRLSYGLLVSLCLLGRASSAPSGLDRYVGSFVASGSILEGANANFHQVRCIFVASRHGSMGLSLIGTCWAYLILSRSVGIDLEVAPGSGRVTGTYTGSRVGMAQLTGRQVGADLDLTIQWPKPLYGDTTANLRVSSLDPDRFRIVVMDRIGINGPVRATTDLTLSKN